MTIARSFALVAALTVPLLAVNTAAHASSPTITRINDRVASGGFYKAGVINGDLSLKSSSLYLQYTETLEGNCNRNVAVYGEGVDQAVAGRIQVGTTAASLPATEVPVLVWTACYTPGGDYIPGSGVDQTITGVLSIDVTGTGPTTRARPGGNIPGTVISAGTITSTEAVAQISLSAGDVQLQRSTDYASLRTIREVVIQH